MLSHLMRRLPLFLHFADVDLFIDFLLTEPQAPKLPAGAENNM